MTPTTTRGASIMVLVGFHVLRSFSSGTSAETIVGFCAINARLKILGIELCEMDDPVLPYSQCLGFDGINGTQKLARTLLLWQGHELSFSDCSVFSDKILQDMLGQDDSEGSEAAANMMICPDLKCFGSNKCLCGEMTTRVELPLPPEDVASESRQGKRMRACAAVAGGARIRRDDARPDIDEVVEGLDILQLLSYNHDNAFITARGFLCARPVELVRAPGKAAPFWCMALATNNPDESNLPLTAPKPEEYALLKQVLETDCEPGWYYAAY
ncbi:hypothetical protein BJ138DRAFT_1181142 [Hygrophoropsis aurantiaca]|uniref:Uncharacterized protein n=1 Tax=Hygrophoropsis aurantiaca TaxID=72124 RepID=A0ACB8A9E4_9AGAM|nr:hypothetical protein BJ138DRAFT_1181142 [Hygrophoropsis aurantiaca]